MRSRYWFLFLASLFLFVSTSGSGNQWKSWEWLNPRPQGHSLAGLGASDSVVVAVGENGTILASENATDWDTVHLKTGLFIEDVIWAGDRFVAVGGYSLGLGEPAYSPGVILTSPDGRRWTEVFGVSGTIFRKAIFNGEQILVVGFRGKTATSPDGVNWVEHTLVDHPFSDIVDVAWNGSTYVGVGARNFFSGGMAIYLSEDGISWTAASLDGIPEMGMLGVVWGHGQFLAFGGLWPGIPFVLSSPDGHSWTEESTNLTGYILEAEATSDGYLGIGTEGQVGKSGDGRTWSMETVIPSSKWLYDVGRFQDKYLVVGEDGAIAVSVDGGDEWAVTTSWELDLVGSNDIIDISSADGILIALSGAGEIFRSLDGYAWQKVEDFPVSTYSVQSVEGAFWVVGSQGLIATSDDGSAWSTRYSEAWVDVTDIATNGEVMVAVGARVLGEFSALVLTSTDGFTWNQIEVEGAEDLRIASVAWTGTRFVGVGNQGSVFRSDDGYSWSFERLDTPPNLWSMRRVHSNGSVVVALASNLDGRFILVSKDDGVTWQATFVDRPVFDVYWTGDLFVAVGGAVWSSHSGDYWTEERVGFLGSPHCVVGDEHEITLAGVSGMVMRAQRITPMLHPRESYPR